MLTGRFGRRNASLSFFSLTNFSWGRALMCRSGNFLNNMCHWPGWLTLSSWLMLFRKDTIRIWSNWFEFLKYSEEIFCESGKRILMPFTCFLENESWSAGALNALQPNFIAISGAGKEVERTSSWGGRQFKNLEVNTIDSLENHEVLEPALVGSCFETLQQLCSSLESLHCLFIYSRCLLKQTFLLYTIQILRKIANIMWSFGHAVEIYSMFYNGLWARGKDWYWSKAEG